MMALPAIKFIYIFCQDLAAMRHFYSELLGLREIYYAAGPAGGLGYDCDGLQFTIFADETLRPDESGWARQPGWAGGDRPVPSWSIPYIEVDFPAALARLRAAGIPAYHEQPQWVGYWSYPVKDPMGNTVEIVLPLKGAPASEYWPD